MTTNADHTFTPDPFPAAAQDRWDVSLRRIQDEGENEAIAAHLRSLWKENWWKYPDDIKRSFLSAARKHALSKTNKHRPTKHVLYRGPVLFNRHDFDWGVWLVLRGIYYDVNKSDTSPKAWTTRLTFQRGPATRMMMERYPGIDVLTENVPPTFPPRPLSWDNKSADEPSGSSALPESKLGAASASNQKSTDAAGQVQSAEPGSGAERTDGESHSPASRDSTTSKAKEGEASHTLASSAGSHPRTNHNLDPSGLDAADKIAPDDSDQNSLGIGDPQNVNSTIGSSGPAPSDGMDEAALEQGSVNEGSHPGGKAVNTPNNVNSHSDEPNSIPSSPLKRRMPDGDEEDSSYRGLHTRKRRSRSSDQRRSAEPEATPNSGPQMTTFGESLERVHGLLKKNLDEMVVECVSQQVARQAESLQPRLKDQMAQFLPEKMFGVTASSELSSIAQKVIDSMAEQVASKITQQVIQRVTQQVTREVTSELQPKADKQIADCIAKITVEKLMGSAGNFEA